MRVAITGASGLVGGALRDAFRGAGDEVTRVVRSRARVTRQTAYWNPEAGEVDEASFEDHDVVVHLAGESLFGVWTKRRKTSIRRSRVQGTELLASALAGLDRPPRLLITASAVGYYGDRAGAQRLDEEAAPGSDFLADVVRGWEAAAAPAEQAGIRTVHLRFGLVLAREGGIVGTLLPLFRLGLGGVVGPGDQVWSWIALPDVVGVVRHVIEHPELRGPVNATSPNAATSREFSRTLGRVLRRPVPFHVPSALVALTPGGMGRSLVLASARVVPERLERSGYRFAFPELEPALRAILT